MQRIGVVTFPGFHVMTLAAMSVFEVANSELGEHRYDVHFLSENGGRVRSSAGFVVETERNPGAIMSPLVPAHIEQPDLRHSKPASVKSLSSPSATASRLTVSEPGTTQARTPGATLRPRAISAAARRSLSRLLVHEPMKTQSTGVPLIGAPGLRPM